MRVFHEIGVRMDFGHLEQTWILRELHEIVPLGGCQQQHAEHREMRPCHLSSEDPGGYTSWAEHLASPRGRLGPFRVLARIWFAHAA